MAATNARTRGSPLASAVSAGPGHIPASPQPTPNTTAPPTSRASTSRRDGTAKLGASTGLVRRITIGNAAAYTVTAPSITNASPGSHAPATSRNASTRAGCVMPPMPSPSANATPTTKATTFLTTATR